jgi:pimeloyl-ACP methyl ester carboxylesterase
MQKIKIENRKGQKIAVIVEENPQAKGLAFVMHGLGDHKEQAHLEVMAQSFFEAGCTVIRFDTVNTPGESDGNYADATVTNYYEDLEDVIAWAKQQNWYKEPFYLAGHSLGAISITLFAEKFSAQVKALAPLSITLPEELFNESHLPGTMEDWRQDGYVVNDIVLKDKGKQFEEDFKTHNILSQINNLRMPVLLVTGGKDDFLEHNKIFHEKLDTDKELHIIEGAAHTICEPEHLLELKNILDNWLKKLNK